MSFPRVGLDFIAGSGDYVRQFTWMGRRICQYPSDLMAWQEIIWQQRPQVVVETGVAYGGSALFIASVLSNVNEGWYVGIDKSLAEVGPVVLPRMTLIEGDSVDPAMVRKVRAAVGNDTAMVILDSDHTEAHVLKELEAYAPLVTPGQYLIVCDTLVHRMGWSNIGQPLPAGVLPRNNPQTTLDRWLPDHPEFEVDESIPRRILITSMPGGYLRRKS